MKYVIQSRREEAVTIDGLGILPAATKDPDSGDLTPSRLELGSDDPRVKAFELQRGMKLMHTTLPEDVEGWVEV